MERFPEKSEAEKGLERGKSPEKIMAGLRVFTEVPFSKYEVTGLENLDKIPPGKKIIIAASHMTDFDMPLAYYALGNKLNIRFTNTRRIAEVSGGDPISYMAIKIAGEQNFYPIDYNKVKEDGRYKGKFNPDNFEPMKEALDEGAVDAVLIAAHNPARDGKLTSGGGYGDVYLAQLADAIIVPVAVNIKSKNSFATNALGKAMSIFERPEVEVTVGEPLTLEKMPNVERFKELFDKKETGPLTEEERQEFKSIKNTLKEQSDGVMNTLAQMVPEEKRGVWGAPQEKREEKNAA